jgi:acyl phosphate:glycerol-3-phosphate acyltransferase
MQTILNVLVVIVISYLLGSIPFGLLVVRLISGKDIRQVESGRTGGTNAMRAAGLVAGLSTALLDSLKSASAVWISSYLIPGNVWLAVLAPVIAVIGHNYSIFLIERKADGKLRLRGGAGGAPTTGGAFGLWAPSVLIIVPLGILILFGIGYASVATMSVAFFATLIFAYRAWLGLSPLQYVAYGVLTEVLLIIALRPNIVRLIKGNERLVGWRAKKANKPYSSSSNSSASS